MAYTFAYNEQRLDCFDNAIRSDVIQISAVRFSTVCSLLSPSSYLTNLTYLSQPT